MRARMPAFAEAVPEVVAPTELARLASVEVAAGDVVAAGQVVARLDASAVDAELAVARAERAKLEAEALLAVGMARRRLDTDLEALLRSLAAEREAAVAARAEVAALDREILRVRSLVDSRQVLASELTALELRHATASALATEKPRTMALLGEQVKAAQSRRDGIAPRLDDAPPERRAELALADRRIEALLLRRDRLVLRAASAGAVASVGKRPGEVVAAGEAVVSLVRAPERVRACAPERVALRVQVGHGARLSRRGMADAPLLEGTVEAVTPGVAVLPSRCWREPTAPEYGREITIVLESPVSLVAGQAFDVELDWSVSRTPRVVPPPAVSFPPPPPSLAPSQLAAPLPSPALPSSPAVAPVDPQVALAGGPLPALGGPRSILVPASLTARTRFEPSALLPRPGEGRYWVVSDDTGRGESEGVPWLFALSPQGAVAEAPILLDGVKEVSDLEAMAASPSGEVYLLSSQSHAKSGRRKPARTALLRVRASAEGLRVDGEVHLAELLDASPTLSAALGLADGTASLDLEGLAFLDGALFVGVKAPLESGRALVWRIGAPAALFAAGSTDAAARLASAQLERFASVKLPLAADGAAMDGGISDLCFLPGGSLALTATPSTGERVAGALFRVDRPARGELSARLVRAYPGKKPEGVAPSLARAGHVALVFDAGPSTPWWDEVPWPR